MLRRGARSESPLVRAVGRAPVGVRTKLLVAFAGIAALLLMVAVLGLRVLGQSNARVETLGTLQLRAATYQILQTQAQQMRQLLSIRAAQDPNLSVYVGVPESDVRGGRRWTLVDLTISAALSQLCPRRTSLLSDSFRRTATVPSCVESGAITRRSRAACAGSPSSTAAAPTAP